jgi:hypothetical protein
MTATEPRFYRIGGSLLPNAPSYMTRRADDELYDGLIQGERGALPWLPWSGPVTARQMGRSSRIVRTAPRLRTAGIAVAILDLAAIGQNLSPKQARIEPCCDGRE